MNWKIEGPTEHGSLLVSTEDGKIGICEVYSATWGKADQTAKDHAALIVAAPALKTAAQESFDLLQEILRTIADNDTADQIDTVCQRLEQAINATEPK
jgi:hypothetical protein